MSKLFKLTVNRSSMFTFGTQLEAEQYVLDHPNIEHARCECTGAGYSFLYEDGFVFKYLGYFGWLFFDWRGRSV